MNFIAALVVGYLVGSFPTAFLLVRQRTGIDIRSAGSGNVGAFNAFDVTSSKTNGVIVGLIDALKGFVVSGLFAWILKVPFTVQAVAFLATIVGHNYPLWLKFKGGRGLATAAGGLFAIGLAYTLVWCFIWLIIYRIRKDIHTANLAAILSTPLVLLAVPAAWLESLMLIDVSGQSFQLLGFILSAFLVVSHWDVVRHIRLTRRSGNE